MQRIHLFGHGRETIESDAHCIVVKLCKRLGEIYRTRINIGLYLCLYCIVVKLCKRLGEIYRTRINIGLYLCLYCIVEYNNEQLETTKIQ